MKTIYNNEKQNQHAEMIKDLKNLPKIETSKNFEYNLMTRIKNKNFGNIEKDKPVFNWMKFLAPSAVAVTAIILLFIFLPSSQQIDNPLINQAQKLENQFIPKNSIPNGKEIVNPSTSNQNLNSTIPESSVAPNNSVQNVNPKMPFTSSRSVSLDDYITGGNNRRNQQRGNIVNSGNESVPLDRFFILENPDQNTLMKYRAQVDSLKKAQMKADSLKKVQKLP